MRAIFLCVLCAFSGASVTSVLKLGALSKPLRPLETFGASEIGEMKKYMIVKAVFYLSEKPASFYQVDHHGKTKM
jgi:hypothetical protein